MCRGGEYISSHHYTDSGQKEEIPVESLKIENNVSYVQKHHEEFMATYERVVSEVETYMESANSGFDSSREQPI